jgi:hypothetical protein
VALDHLPKRGGHNHDRVQLEVVVQLSLGEEDGVQELLDLRVVHLGVGQDFTDEVDRTLHFEGVTLLLSFHHDGGTHHLSRGCDIQ